jgi:putative FmdB family regulatory protein
MPLFDFQCKTCSCTWEDILFTGDPLPIICPNCNTEREIVKLVSCPSMGKVILTGQELKQKIQSDAAKIRKEAATNENFAANLTGESKYQNKVQAREHFGSEIKRIK